MTTKVYLVTDGDYSDYHVIGVYSTREKAEAIKEAWKAKNEIVEMGLDDTFDWVPGLSPWSIVMLRNGDTTYVGETSPAQIKWSESRLSGVNPAWMNKDGVRGASNIWVSVWAEDETHAVKIVNERRAQLIANGEWPEDVFKEPVKFDSVVVRKKVMEHVAKIRGAQL